MNAVNAKTEKIDLGIFFKNTKKAIILIDAQGLIIEANTSAQTLFGYEKKEFHHQNIKLLIPSIADTEKFADNDITCNIFPYELMDEEFEAIAKKKDGHEFPADICVVSYVSNKQKKMILFIKDVTKKAMEHLNIQKKYSALEIDNDRKNKELIKANKTLEELNEKLELLLVYQNAILDNAAVMFMVIDRDGIIKFFNTEATHITGYTKEEIVNKETPFIFIDKSDTDKYRKQFFEEFGLKIEKDFELIKLKSERNLFHDIECNIIKKDGSCVIASVTITPIFNKDNETTGYLAFAIDITDRKLSEKNLQESLNKERELGELKTRFVSIASHEFRTPLSTILSSACLIGKYTNTDEQPKRDRHINRIISSVNLLSDILNDFLNVGQIEEGKIPVKVTEFDISKLFESLIQDLKSNIKNGQKINYIHNGDNIVYSDSSLLSNILINLISNAIKFSPENSIIVIESVKVNKSFTISVKDNGIGISDDDKKHLMERFYRGSNAINIQGTGLGMHIVSKYVERLNGKLEFESQLNCGTEFKIMLPNQKESVKNDSLIYENC